MSHIIEAIFNEFTQHYNIVQFEHLTQNDSTHSIIFSVEKSFSALRISQYFTILRSDYNYYKCPYVDYIELIDKILLIFHNNNLNKNNENSTKPVKHITIQNNICMYEIIMQTQSDNNFIEKFFDNFNHSKFSAFDITLPKPILYLNQVNLSSLIKTLNETKFWIIIYKY